MYSGIATAINPCAAFEQKINAQRKFLALYEICWAACGPPVLTFCGLLGDGIQLTLDLLFDLADFMLFYFEKLLVRNEFLHNTTF